jgi:hypothetical protein
MLICVGERTEMRIPCLFTRRCHLQGSALLWKVIGLVEVNASEVDTLQGHGKERPRGL